MLRASSPRCDLWFGVLGRLQVWRNGSELDPGGPKQRSVLTMLVINANKPLSVDRIVEELWLENPPPSAVATLQAYVSTLRRILEPDRPARSPSSILLHCSGSYELRVATDQVDALRFERLAEEGASLLGSDPVAARLRLIEALSLWRGEALADLNAAELATAERARLDELRITATENRIEADMAMGQSRELIAELEQLVADHPFRERLWARLISSYYRAGRQAEALRAYRRCESMLSDELGIAPSAELRSLELAVLNQDPGLSAPTSAQGSRQKEYEPQQLRIVGRATEMQSFKTALNRAELGRGTVMLVDGDIGIGKTRLLEAIYETANAAGFRAALARCVEVGGTPPFWPWTQICQAIGSDVVQSAAGPYGSYLTPLLPKTAPSTFTEGGPGPERYRVAEGLVEALRTLGSSGPIVVLIDDLYCADPDSLSVLTLVAAGISNLPIVLVGTHRGFGLAPDDPLAEALVQLTRFEWCERVHLDRLDRADTAELVRITAGVDLDAETLDNIHRRTEGNAFFTVELGRLLVEEENRGSGSALSAIPATVKGVVERRLSGISPSAMRIVRTAAVAGRTFDLAVVAEAADAPLAEALDLADAAVRAGVVKEVGIGWYRFSHVLMVETIVAYLGALRRAQLHQRLADVIEARASDTGERLDEIAHHRVEAIAISGPAPAIEALARAGRRAAAVNALELADQLLEHRADLVMSLPAGPDRDQAEVDSILDRSVVWTWLHGYQSNRMRSAVERLLELTEASSSQAILDPSTETGVRYGVLPALQAHCSYEIVAGNVYHSTELTNRLLDLASANPHPYVVAVANINAMCTAIQAGRISDSISHATQNEGLLEQVDPGLSGKVTLALGQQSLVVTHFAFSSWAHWMNGAPDLARSVMARGREVADRSDHPFTRTFHASIECLVAAMDDNPEWVNDALDWCPRTPQSDLFSFLDAMTNCYEIWSDGMAGGLRAPDRLRVGLERLDANDARVVQTVHWSLLAELELKVGQPERALEAAREGIARSNQFGERFWYSELERISAMALEALGLMGEANVAGQKAEAAAIQLGTRQLVGRARAWRALIPQS